MTDHGGSHPPGWGQKWFDRLVLDGPMPYLIVGATIAVTLFLSYFLKNFQMDASTDSIVLESDKDLRYYNRSRQLFGTDDYVVAIIPTNSPETLFSDKYIEIMRELCDDLKKVRHVESLMSILDVPLFHSPDVPLMKVAKDYKTLGKDADRQLAIKELTESPLYSDYIISKDGKTAAIQLNFDPDREFMKLAAERQALMEKKLDSSLTREESARLTDLNAQYKKRHAELSEERRQDINAIRTVLGKYEKKYPEIGKLHLGGVPMMIADMIDYVEHDIWVFGLAAILFMFVTLAFIFRRLGWVLPPILACMTTTLMMIGYLSWTKWQTTVVTSNFSSLLLILTLSTAVHIVSQCRELGALLPDYSKKSVISAAVRSVFVPCFFMVVTTVVGFASLMMSGIRPVMDFGKVMSVGLTFSFLMCFVVMPAAMMLFTKPEKTPPPEGSADHSNMFPLAEFTGKHPIIVGIVSLILLLFFCVGVLRISVEARFIDYFRKSTPIYQSITMLDEKMGGAMPLEVVLEGEGKDYWLEPANLETLGKVHKFIENLPETAKVISGETMREILQKVNKGNPVSKTIFNMARNALPKEYYRYIIEPYMTPDFDQARIMIRVHDSDPKLNRTELRRKIEDFLNNEMKLKVGEKSHITGYFILYNNMLQSLYTSQINTVGSVFITVWVMFFILFRSFKLALIGLVPNVIAVCTILGTMGWLGIHLDMMTVMIAAITFGMADDNTIHYIHRFQHEFPKDRNYVATMYRCHDTIGRPLSYTMLTTVAGFAILVLSNFIPTAYFGLFTGLAMFVALMATHTILPMMIITLKPFGRETPASAKPE